MSAGKGKGPEFLRFVGPILETLRELGGSGTAAEITDRVVERCEISDAELEATTSNGQSRVRNQIAWARSYLAKACLLDSSQRGVWALTDMGRKAAIDADSVRNMFRGVQKQFAGRPRPEKGDGSTEQDFPEGEVHDYCAQLLATLRALSAGGFERVCQRLLRESGFQQVVVTGRSNDGGIDGHGVLEINPLVTFKVLFQCKRCGDRSVSPAQVRDFRGAMQGRADKGLILTTGTFTQEARKEASRDGGPPIELVDGEKLVSMFERAELGLRPRRTYELDPGFFDDYRE